jgi:hypothetical protein
LNKKVMGGIPFFRPSLLGYPTLFLLLAIPRVDAILEVAFQKPATGHPPLHPAQPGFSGRR